MKPPRCCPRMRLFRNDYGKWCLTCNAIWSMPILPFPRRERVIWGPLPATAPDATLPAPLRLLPQTSDAHLHQERIANMKNSPDNSGGAAGSNPAGVASQTTPEETGNADRTELRSVSPHENPPECLAPRGLADVSPLERRRVCRWCRRELPPTVRRDAEFCGRNCRQTAFRLRRRSVVEVLNDRPLRLAYADPPYPGLAKRYYQHEPTYAGEVDHRELLASLEYSYDGWALSTSVRALPFLLPLCPAGVRVCAWVKPKGASPNTYGLHNSWEPVLVKPARAQRPGVRDWLLAHAARGGGTLPGRKPLAFCAWLFECLGARPGDELADLFPGTGIVGRAWLELGGRLLDPSPLQAGDVSAAAAGDVSPTPAGYAAPDRVTFDFPQSVNAPTTNERTLVMSQSPTGEESTTGSNPAGVALPTSDDHDSSASGTARRSVETPGNSPGDTDPLTSLQPGDPVEVLWIPLPGRPGKSGWIVATFEVWENDGWAARITGLDPNGEMVRSVGRTSIRVPAAAPEVPPLHGPVGTDDPWPPEVRRCTVPVGRGHGLDNELCNAVLGADLHCEVCKASRCYRHCAGLDHFAGRLISRGGSGSGEDSIEWKVVEIALGRFRGQVYEKTGGKLEIVGDVSGSSAEEALAQLEVLVRELERLHVAKRDEENLRAFDKVRGYKTPRVVPIGRIEAGRAPQEVNDALDDVLKTSSGRMANTVRGRLLIEVLEWLRDSEAEWNELAGVDAAAALACKRLHDQQIVALFSRIGGAL